MLKERAASDKIHDEVNPIVLLEHVMHFDDERVVNCEHDYLFKFYLFNEVLLQQVVFLDALNCEVLVFCFQIRQEYGTKGAFVNKLQNLEIFKGYIARL